MLSHVYMTICYYLCKIHNSRNCLVFFYWQVYLLIKKQQQNEMIFCKNSNAVLSRQKIPCPRSLLAFCLNTIYSWSQGSKLHMDLVVLVKKCQLWQPLAKSAQILLVMSDKKDWWISWTLLEYCYINTYPELQMY